MTDAQLDLFGTHHAPYQAHSSTSRAAAAWADASGLAETARGRVLRCIIEHGPVTDEQIADLLAMNPSTQRPRRVELEADGLIVNYGLDAPARSGRLAARWVAAW
jgi:predicted ArsR family transcriptional regulator